jgi:hypothetical protein
MTEQELPCAVRKQKVAGGGNGERGLSGLHKVREDY